MNRNRLFTELQVQSRKSCLRGHTRASASLDHDNKKLTELADALAWPLRQLFCFVIVAKYLVHIPVGGFFHFHFFHQYL